jgi:hypothetical protein
MQRVRGFVAVGKHGQRERPANMKKAPAALSDRGGRLVRNAANPWSEDRLPERIREQSSNDFPDFSRVLT